MIQGGDPKGNGSGGSENKIKGEFTKNGVENDISHTRGTISMARAQDPNSASSQFFIMQADNSTLNGNYAAFGTVTSGMDVVDAICKGVTPTDSNGTIPASEQPVIESITMIDQIPYIKYCYFIEFPDVFYKIAGHWRITPFSWYTIVIREEWCYASCWRVLRSPRSGRMSC